MLAGTWEHDQELKDFIRDKYWRGQRQSVPQAGRTRWKRTRAAVGTRRTLHSLRSFKPGEGSNLEAAPHRWTSGRSREDNRRKGGQRASSRRESRSGRGNSKHSSNRIRQRRRDRNRDSDNRRNDGHSTDSRSDAKTRRISSGGKAQDGRSKAASDRTGRTDVKRGKSRRDGRDRRDAARSEDRRQQSKRTKKDREDKDDRTKRKSSAGEAKSM
jgi:hypothetical protein